MGRENGLPSLVHNGRNGVEKSGHDRTGRYRRQKDIVHERTCRVVQVEIMGFRSGPKEVSYASKPKRFLSGYIEMQRHITSTGCNERCCGSRRLWSSPEENDLMLRCMPQ
jgi:hypothetical protein